MLLRTNWKKVNIIQKKKRIQKSIDIINNYIGGFWSFPKASVSVCRHKAADSTNKFLPWAQFLCLLSHCLSLDDFSSASLSLAPGPWLLIGRLVGGCGDKINKDSVAENSSLTQCNMKGEIIICQSRECGCVFLRPLSYERPQSSFSQLNFNAWTRVKFNDMFLVLMEKCLIGHRIFSFLFFLPVIIQSLEEKKIQNCQNYPVIWNWIDRIVLQRFLVWKSSIFFFFIISCHEAWKSIKLPVCFHNGKTSRVQFKKFFCSGHTPRHSSLPSIKPCFTKTEIRDTDGHASVSLTMLTRAQHTGMHKALWWINTGTHSGAK